MDTQKKQPNFQLKQARESYNWTQGDLAAKIGTTQKIVSRWERGESVPLHYYRQKLCKLFEKNATELGFLPDIHNHSDGIIAYGKTLDIPEKSAESELEDMNPARRETIKLLAATTIGSSVALSHLHPLDQDILERFLRALHKPSTIDDQTLANLAVITKQHWQMLHTTIDPTRYSLFSSLFGHLQTITQLLEYSLPTHAHNFLCILASETTQIIGEILFDMNDNHRAKLYYDSAIEAAKTAHNDVLTAVVLGRKSFLPIYEKNARSALPLLQEAHRLTAQNAPDITRAWLSAIEAEAHANNGDAYTCSKALERAEYFLDRVKPDETGYAHPGEPRYARFGRVVLLGYKGICYTRLHQPETARKFLQESIALMDHTRLRHKSITLVDLAMTHIQQHNIEEAYGYTEQAITIMLQTRSPRTFDRVLDLRHALEPWETETLVKHLDEQIVTARPLMK